jgi:hypothetical protein
VARSDSLREQGRWEIEIFDTYTRNRAQHGATASVT